MKAAVMHGRLDIRFEDIPMPEPAEDELLVQIACAGICGTDASEYTRGPSMFPIEHENPVTGHCGPMVPGHEFSGFVAGVGNRVTGFSEGDLITSGAGISCGSCRMCRAGRDNLCDVYSSVGLERNGGLAEFTTVPANACLNIDHRPLGADTAALAQPMSVAVHAMRRGRPTEAETIVVLGAGAIGAFLIHAVSKEAPHVVAVDVRADRLESAHHLGATETIQVTRDAPILDQLADRGIGPELVYECTGVASNVDAAAGLVQRGGRVVIVGLQKAPVPFDLYSLALQEKELIGTLAHVFGSDFEHATNLLEDGVDLWKHAAPEVHPLGELVDRGLRPMTEGGLAPIKSLFDPRASSSRALGTG